ncbi:hypothetical protein I2485_07220 [Nesterenkonia sp. E16_7]|uniref:variant leucine-rich repeat-containing protein n=1 Tax=unclassified Nesterenkonia TaxID=2629769 RepID=UPI001A91D4AD|nr:MULTISPECIES: hypothetical protein [unclassified Nesterenkonia]MBO0594349.1 hypothetical protein [Nesterenkonia sp. E16_10]MBO0598441.1 hypothetical protein [Nesterenkonia sp. E16_7]
MTDGPHQSPTGPAARAADPNTPQVQLQMLAGDHPELRPLIAQNPNTYPELLQWLAELHDPAVDAALARRAAGTGPRPDPGEDEFSAVRQERPQDYAPSQPRHGYYPAAPTGPAPWESRPGPAPWEAPASQAPYAEPEPRRRHGGTCAILFLILLVAAAAVVAAYFLIFNGVFSGDDEPSEETSISQDQNEQGQDPEETGAQGAESEAPEEEDAEIVRPAPEDAQDIPAFTAPSGNINCIIGEDELECSILDYSFDTEENCDGPARFSVGSEDPQLGCGSTEGENSATLQYGQSAGNGRFACVSSESGFECWNTETGDGFFMARESYQLQN